MLIISNLIKFHHQDLLRYKPAGRGGSPFLGALGWVTPLRPQNNFVGIFLSLGVNTFHCFPNWIVFRNNLKEISVRKLRPPCYQCGPRLWG